MSYQRDCDTDAWTACSPGTLHNVAAQLRAARRRTTITRAMTPLIVLSGLTASVWLTPWLIDSSKTDSGGISCSEVRIHLGHYASRQLPDDLSENIAAHLQRCPLCQAKLRSLDSQAMGVVEEQAIDPGSRISRLANLGDLPTLASNDDLAMP